MKSNKIRKLKLEEKEALKKLADEKGFVLTSSGKWTGIEEMLDFLSDEIVEEYIKDKAFTKLEDHLNDECEIILNQCKQIRDYDLEMFKGFTDQRALTASMLSKDLFNTFTARGKIPANGQTLRSISYIVRAYLMGNSNGIKIGENLIPELNEEDQNNQET